ncbi:MAG TPA: AsnC family transcriptional regulator [Streptosporangiaceae bacterium]|jgi:DNA-binding Lrp family transcriptional regulator
MEAVSIDQLDRQIIHALIVDGRAPFSRIAAVVGVSEQTVARRYRRMHAAGIVRVAGLPDSQRFGQSDWVVRLQCVPDAAAGVASALARRADTTWVSLMSGGTEISCVVKPAGSHSRHDLLLRQLPGSRRIVSISAQSILHVFRGGASHWPGASKALTPEQEAMLATAPGVPGPPAAAPYPRSELGPEDRILLAELARDGRASYAEIASAVHWHESTVRRRVEELRAAGILYLDVDIDASAFGINTHAGLYLSVAPARLADAGGAIAQHPEVPFVAATSGKSNLIATVLCRDDYDLYRYLTERIAGLDGVTALEAALIIRTAKRAAAVLEPERSSEPAPAA